MFYVRWRFYNFGPLHVFLSPGINILEDPEMELPPLKMSTALPRSFHQIISLLQILSTGFLLHREGDSGKAFELQVNFIPQAWTVLAQLATGQAPVWCQRLSRVTPVGTARSSAKLARHPAFFPDASFSSLVSGHGKGHLESPEVNGGQSCLCILYAYQTYLQ